MKYMGSKNRIAKHLLPIMLENRKGRTWVEPFVGGANMIDKVGGKRIGADNNEYLIAMWKELQEGWIPKDLYSREEYNNVKENKEIDPTLAGYVGINCSYSGVWFSGYAGVVNTRGGVRNYQDEAKRNTLKQVPSIQSVSFIHASYKDLEIPKSSLIYCDPPYENTSEYKVGGFNNAEFWQWCRERALEGHQVYISEYNAPEDFICLISLEVGSSLGSKGRKKSVEKLFIYNDLW